MLQLLIPGLAGGGSAAAGAWLVLWVHLRYHKEAIDRAQQSADRAHARIDALRGSV